MNRRWGRMLGRRKGRVERPTRYATRAEAVGDDGKLKPGFYWGRGPDKGRIICTK